ncbi:hypothetical protein EVAR_34475_1 [Eumeta japonica]|uniref:Uncharacterized protein n=1 Tax=Eumeta variegata TaxID=151549 RepID=A0A4C1WVT4_EUMVA|nr:hypothetical protein EVAR_34475_1 [Eumeta japonica]
MHHRLHLEKAVEEMNDDMCDAGGAVRAGGEPWVSRYLDVANATRNQIVSHFALYYKYALLHPNVLKKGRAHIKAESKRSES